MQASSVPYSAKPYVAVKPGESEGAQAALKNLVVSIRTRRLSRVNRYGIFAFSYLRVSFNPLGVKGNTQVTSHLMFGLLVLMA
jgi:hypothetical protein